MKSAKAFASKLSSDRTRIIMLNVPHLLRGILHRNSIKWIMYALKYCTWRSRSPFECANCGDRMMITTNVYGHGMINSIAKKKKTISLWIFAALRKRKSIDVYFWYRFHANLILRHGNGRDSLNRPGPEIRTCTETILVMRMHIGSVGSGASSQFFWWFYFSL